jgi:hypothetical protein
MRVKKNRNQLNKVSAVLQQMIKYRCRKCSQEVSFEAYRVSNFCPNCGTHLEEVHILEPPIKPGKGDRTILRPQDVHTDQLWSVYMNEQIEVSAGYIFPSVNEWVKRRKQVYIEYRHNFAPEKLNDLNALKRDFQHWLLFRNNLSWTTLQRTASNAIEHPQRLAKLLSTLQNEDLKIDARIRSTLQGADKINGLGQGIVTALLHTFNNEKYWVWNSRTVDTLKKLHRPTFPSDDLGETYKRVNRTLNELAEDMQSDLTTVDGFMWFVSKKYEFL